MAAPNRTEYAVLGLLNTGLHQTGYDIKKMADGALGHFWNESFGHLYPILKRLVKRGWLVKSEEPQQGRPNRKVYALTERGKEALRAWFAEPVEPPPAREEILLKLFLGRQTDPDTLAAQLHDYRARLAEELVALESLEAQAAAEEVHNPDLAYWRLTVSHRRATVEAQIAWAEDALATLPAPSAA